MAHNNVLKKGLRLPLSHADSWHTRAACSEANPDLFDGDDLARGLDYCRPCTVTAECLEQGQRERGSGVWGGLILHYGQVQRDFAVAVLSDDRIRELHAAYARTPRGERSALLRAAEMEYQRRRKRRQRDAS